MPHELPPLPYAHNALAPDLDEDTLRDHHGVVHLEHIKGLRRAEEALSAARADGNHALLAHWKREIAFHGSEHALHSLYWHSMSPTRDLRPTGDFLEALQRDIGGLEDAQAEFLATAGAIRGCGWAIVGVQPSTGSVSILRCEGSQSEMPIGVTPILACDLWEHAYYLKYRCRRGEYARAFWSLIDWDGAARRFAEAVR